MRAMYRGLLAAATWGACAACLAHPGHEADSSLISVRALGAEHLLVALALGLWCAAGLSRGRRWTGAAIAFGTLITALHGALHALAGAAWHTFEAHAIGFSFAIAAMLAAGVALGTVLDRRHAWTWRPAAAAVGALAVLVMAFN